jgi:prepilin-type N-terminal cleavage/methylation domain-containing protein
MQAMPPSDLTRQHGFSLVELAVVMAIVTFLLGGLMFTLSAQTEQRNFEDTRRRLEQARELILAFAIVNGRLPCPARSAATASPATVAGDEVVTTATGCIGDAVTDYYGGSSGGVTLGLLPSRSIGFQQTDASGFAVDAWGNRIRYAVARLTTPAGSCPTPHFVNATNLKANGVSCQPNDLLICKSGTGITSTDCGSGANQIMTASLVVAIIYSTGKNGATGGTGTDEAANLNGDRVFVYHTPAPSSSANGEFDDQFVWITTGEFYGKLIAAGQLP